MTVAELLAYAQAAGVGLVVLGGLGMGIVSVFRRRRDSMRPPAQPMPQVPVANPGPPPAVDPLGTTGQYPAVTTATEREMMSPIRWAQILQRLDERQARMDKRIEQLADRNNGHGAMTMQEGNRRFKEVNGRIDVLSDAVVAMRETCELRRGGCRP